MNDTLTRAECIADSAMEYARSRADMIAEGADTSECEQAIRDCARQLMTELHPVAHCGSAMAAWLDPSGALQRAGCLIVED